MSSPKYSPQVDKDKRDALGGKRNPNIENIDQKTGDYILKTNPVAVQIKQMIAGAAAGALTRTLTQPFDVLKIRFQLQVEPVAESSHPTLKSKYTSLWQACRLIMHEEGWRAFWKGHNPGQFMSVSYGVMQFWTYEQISLGLSNMPWLRHEPGVTSFVSGGLAGCLATIVTMPFDVVRTRVVAIDHAHLKHQTMWQVFGGIMRTEGVPGLFRGLATTLIQIGPLVGANFMFYNYFNEWALKFLEPDDPEASHLSTWILLLNGGAAGTASKAAVYPLDFIKKRLQLQGFVEQRQTFGRNQVCNGILECIKITLKEEGLMGFYKGMTPTLLKSGFTTALYFSFYDKFKHMMHV